MAGALQELELLQLETDILQMQHDLLELEEQENQAEIQEMHCEDGAKRNGRKKKKRGPVRGWITEKGDGLAFKLLPTLYEEYPLEFKNYCRLDGALFQYVVSRLRHQLTKNPNNNPMFYPVPVETKLAIFLRYIATGTSQIDLMYQYRFSRACISKIIASVASAIVAEFANELLAMPANEQEWKDIAMRFSNKWQYHNCVGAMDGKHIRIVHPPHSGTDYYNYKGFYSFVLFAIADADYIFRYVNVGACGGGSDAGVFRACGLLDKFENNEVKLPEAACIPHDNVPTNFHLVADAAFPLKKWLMKPHGGQNRLPYQRAFDYRLSRARRCVENAFGLLNGRFQILQRPLNVKLETAENIVIAMCIFHNMMIKSKQIFPQMDGKASVDDTFVLEQQQSCDGSVLPGSWRTLTQLTPLNEITGRNLGMREAKQMRDTLSKYYYTIGRVPWQQYYI